MIDNEKAIPLIQELSGVFRRGLTSSHGQHTHDIWAKCNESEAYRANHKQDWIEAC
jgi:hypothetical protein